MASGMTLPFEVNGSAPAMLENSSCTLLLIRSTNDGPTPLYGTWTAEIPVCCAHIAAARCGVVPTPAEA